jgi:hypothetical protein
MNTLIEQILKEEWIEHIITFLSVFLGACFAYHFSIHQDNQKDKKQQIENYNILWNKIALSMNNLFTYKEVYLDTIKQAFEKNDFDEALKTSYVLDCDFSFDDHHYFLNLYNRCFLTELSFLSKINNLAIEEINNYYNDVFIVRNKLNNKDTNFFKEYEILKNSFMILYNNFEHLCARAYYINKEFVKGFDKYFNLYNYEGLLENFEIEAKIAERIKNEECLNFIKERENQFDVYWQIAPNMWCNICFKIRKVKHYVKYLWTYIQKPKICKNCRCCKIKAQKRK